MDKSRRTRRLVFAKVVRRLVYKILSDVGNFVVQLRDLTLAYFQ